MELNENVLVSNSKIALGSLEKNDVAFFDKEEKLVRSSKGFVVVVKGGLLFIPKFDKLDPKLEAVLGLANDLGYVSKSGELKKEHLQIADGLFLVGPRDDIVTIESFNGYAYTKELELVDEIKKSFDNIVSGKDSSYAHWFD